LLLLLYLLFFFSCMILFMFCFFVFVFYFVVLLFKYLEMFFSVTVVVVFLFPLSPLLGLVVNGLVFVILLYTYFTFICCCRSLYIIPCWGVISFPFYF